MARNRVYVRKFDWDEAKRLRKSGVRVVEIAERLGVSIESIYQVTNPKRQRQVREYGRIYQATKGTCSDCGCSKSTAGKRCRDCDAQNKCTTVKDGEAKCLSCGIWQPLWMFAHNRAARKTRLGRHTQCTACNTRRRREWREKNRERQRAYDRERSRRRRSLATGG